MTVWCVNFDGDAGPQGNQDREYVLRHGLQENMWLMHYQYSQNGHAFQGHPNQLAATTKNWRAAAKIGSGDWLVAYLKPKRVFAVGEVIPTRNRSRHRNQPTHEDTIERTTSQHAHQYLDGLVHYSDAGTLYEDFTDSWNLPLTNSYSNLPEVWPYPQRVDVKEWLHVVPRGIQVEGPWKDVPPYMRQLAVFEIPDPFFDSITNALQQAAGG